MIIEEGTYYLYRHIRLDTNEVFYIGIGKKAKTGRKFKYKRAYDFVQRSKFWKRVYNKCRKDIKVDFLIESNDKEFIKQKEIEFITLYGRKNLDLGSLVNLTDGGDYVSEIMFSQKRIQSLREARKGIRPSDKCLKASREAHIIKVYQYDLEGNFIKEFESITIAAKNCNAYITNISRCCKNRLHSSKGFIWKYYKTDKIEPAKVTWKSKIYKYSLEKELIIIYNNSEEASHFEKLHYSTIHDYCRRNYKPDNKPFFFSYSCPENINDVKVNEKKEKSPLKNQKCIIVLKNNEFYKKYNSIAECSRDLKIRRNKLSESLNKNKIIYKNIKIIKDESK